MGKSRIGNGLILAGLSGIACPPFFLPCMIIGFIVGYAFPIF